MEELVNPSDAAAGATAMERIQERFLQRTLGGAFLGRVDVCMRVFLVEEAPRRNVQCVHYIPYLLTYHRLCRKPPIHPPPAASTLTMADFTDTTWLEAAREGLLGNADIVRLIGDDRMLSILANPSMVPRLASQFPDPEALLSSW